MTKVKLLLDEDVHFELASALRKRGYDAIHVQELERKGYSDRQQFDNHLHLKPKTSDC